MLNHKIRALFCINTPAQAHTWRRLILYLLGKGHEVRILARDYGSTVEILTSYGLRCSTFKPIKRGSIRLFEILVHLQKGYEIAQGFDPTIVIGFGVDAALTAALLRRPCIVFTDGEPIPLQHFLTRLFAGAILTPDCFTKDLGKKHIRIPGYKELAYLHPDYFKPAPSIYEELGIDKDEKYVILRFNAFDAVHDIGRHGFSTSDQFRLVEELGKYARVFISPEGGLPEELEKHRLPISYDRIHHVLYYAQMLVSDTGTMTTEAAILGTPGIMCLSNAEQFGNFVELEHKYDLMYSFQEPEKAVQKAIELIQRPNLKEEWAKKRQALLNDKIDVTQFMVNFIENYPDSFEQYRREAGITK
jgi:predicted glycosyltransferase